MGGRLAKCLSGLLGSKEITCTKKGFAWVTLATNDSYSLGALVLAHSLRQVKTVHQLAVLITPAVSPPMRTQLESIFDVVKIVDVLDSKDETNLALLKRPELGITFTKLHCWQLTQFEKGVFLDADTLVVRNCDELFEREEFSAAPDVGWPDCFNSGVFVFRPALETFNNLVQFAVEKGSFDGGDQGLLNQFFNSWATDDIRKHLPFVYNLTSVAVYSYIPAFKQYGADTRIVHFIGPVKPWLQPVDPATRTVTPSADSTHLQPLLQQWWDIFIAKVHPGLSSDLECAFGMLPFFAQPACSQDPLDCTHARSDPFFPSPGPPLIETQAPDFPDPYTPYIEKDDERQYNLPYQPFQVVSSEGELLNITFADYARESEPIEENIISVADPNPEPEPEPEQEPEANVAPAAPHVEEHHEPKQEETVQKFDFHQFVPDEVCINSYLEHNVQEYQPYEFQQSEQIFEPLPRFLTIPEDDPRQSQKPYEPEIYWPPPPEAQEISPPWEEPLHVHDMGYRPPSPIPEVRNEPPPAITKSRSMSNLVIDAADTASFQNVTPWKSQPDVGNVAETMKKLPGLKPLVPKDKSPVKSLSSPKYTEFTEVNMSVNYSDPFAPPVDNIGFVERAIMSQKNRSPKFDIPQGVFPPVAEVSPPRPIQQPLFETVPQMNEYVDLADCKRQAGNVADAVPMTSGGLKTFTPKISPRRSKRTARRTAEKWKPPETTNSMYDVDDILKRLSAFSIGYKPPSVSDEQANAVVAAPVSQETETPADRLFRGSVLEESIAKVSHRNGIPVDKEPVKKASLMNFGPLDHSSPFAAPQGQSLSECSVPEIVVCVSSPDAQNGSITTPGKILDETFVVAARRDKIETDDETFLTPIGNDAEKSAILTSSEDSFLSALSSPMAKTDEAVSEITEKMNAVVLESVGTNENGSGIFDVKEWEEALDNTIVLGDSVEISPVVENLNELIEINAPSVENLPTIMSTVNVPSNKSYAAIVKKDAVIRVKPIEPVRIAPKPVEKPQQNGLKRPRKFKNKPKPVETKPDLPLIKYHKRKIEKPEIELPVNRFELLPEETQKFTHPRKKAKKVSNKFAMPSSSFSSSLPTSSDIVNAMDGEEEATPHLPEPDDNPGIAGAIAQLKLDPGSAAADLGNSVAQAEYLRRQSWETGQVDYMGRDSFANVWSKISETLSQSSIPENPSSPTAPSTQQ